jgi:hypothetical protein
MFLISVADVIWKLKSSFTETLLVPVKDVFSFCERRF